MGQSIQPPSARAQGRCRAGEPIGTQGCIHGEHMLNLFSKDKALYLVDNPTKWGFSWWFFWAGIAAGYAMHQRYGDSHSAIMVVEKYVSGILALMLGLTRNWVTKRVRTGVISRDSTLLYLIPPAGYVFTSWGAMWFSHMTFAIVLQ